MVTSRRRLRSAVAAGRSPAVGRPEGLRCHLESLPRRGLRSGRDGVVVVVQHQQATIGEGRKNAELGATSVKVPSLLLPTEAVGREMGHVENRGSVVIVVAPGRPPCRSGVLKRPPSRRRRRTGRSPLVVGGAGASVRDGSGCRRVRRVDAAVVVVDRQAHRLEGDRVGQAARIVTSLEPAGRRVRGARAAGESPAPRRRRTSSGRHGRKSACLGSGLDLRSKAGESVASPRTCRSRFK